MEDAQGDDGGVVDPEGAVKEMVVEEVVEGREEEMVRECCPYYAGDEDVVAVERGHMTTAQKEDGDAADGQS